MDADAAVRIADAVLFADQGQHLTDIQQMILRESLAGKTYEQMDGYDRQHIKNEGAALWQLLSQALGERVSKKNFRAALARRSQAVSPEISSADPPPV